LQGYDLEHPVIQILMNQKPASEFLEEELQMREMLAYPPFSRLVRFRIEHENENACRDFSTQVADELRKELGPEHEHRLMGPSEALLYRAQNRYRFDIYFKSPTVDLLYRISRGVRQMASQAEINLIVDVDPYNS
jgi:primosomal protein N' (replication factor Y)